MQAELVLRQGRLLEGREVDLAIANGVFVAIGHNLSVEAPRELDLGGELVLPPFVESHIHLDSVFTAGQPRWNESGTLFEGIEIWRERKQSLTQADVEERAYQALKILAQQGVLFVRSHADVSEANLSALKGLLAVRERVKNWLTLQVVAFPQDGLYSSPEQESRLQLALDLGADVIGGIPHYELTREDGVRSVQQMCQWAERYDRRLDLHCDEIDDPQSRFLEVVVAEAIRRDLGDRVTASHTTAFGSYDNAYALKLLGFIQRSQVNFVVNPLINITLQGRTDTYPKRRGLTRVKELWQAGANISLGHDCICDPWYSLGTGQMLNVAHMAVHVAQMTGRQEVEACLKMVTEQGATTLGVRDAYGIEVGKPANLVVLPVADAWSAVRLQPLPRYVFSRGQLVAQTPPPFTEWFCEE